MAADTGPEKQPPYPGHAGVVGAGISGLSAAIALRRAGWHVEVFERSQFKNEIGAAITVTPNAALVLDRWGFDMEKAEAVPNQSKVVALATDPSVILDRQEYADRASEMGFGVWSLHRVDLHRGLRDIAAMPTMEPGYGPPARIRLGCEVRKVGCEEGALTMSDGQVVNKDLVVIADGAHSRLISDFTGRPPAVRRINRSIYRWLVSMEDVMAEPDLREIYNSEPLPGFVAWHEPDENMLWVTYRCRGGKVLNIAAGHPTQPGQGDGEVWHSRVSSAEVLATAEKFHPSIKKLVGMATEDGINIHHLSTRPPLTSFVRGRTVVVGDAAHVMVPAHAAGASIAIESAASLEVLFRGVEGTDDLTMRNRLESFDRLRIPRCNLTMLVSNANRGLLDQPGVKDEVRRFYSGPLPPPGALPYSKAWREILFHHDEYRAAEELLARAGSEVEGRTEWEMACQQRAACG